MTATAPVGFTATVGTKKVTIDPGATEAGETEYEVSITDTAKTYKVVVTVVEAEE